MKTNQSPRAGQAQLTKSKAAPKLEAVHTPGAVHAAQIITGGDYDSPRRYRTVYGMKTCQGVADIIDRETHAPELLEALRSAVAQHQIRCDIAGKLGLQAPTSEGWVRHARAVIAKAEATQ